MKTRFWQAVLVIIAVCMFGCMPKDVRKQTKQVPKQIAASAQKVKSLDSAYTGFKRSLEYDNFIKPYAERENWDSVLAYAHKRIQDAEAHYTDLKALVKDGDKKKANQAYNLLARIKVARENAVKAAKHPQNRISLLRDAKKNSGSLVEKAEAQMKATHPRFAALSAFVVKARSDFPKRDGDLKTKHKMIKNIYDEAVRTTKIVREQLESSAPDYAILGDGCALVNNSTQKVLPEKDAWLRSKVGELGSSYSKILVDMKQRFWIQVGCESWDNSSDWSHDPHVYSPREVKEGVYEYYSKLPADQTLATNNKQWRGGNNTKLGIDQGMWNALGLNIVEGWERGDDEGMYYVNDIIVKYYHTYIIVKDGKKTETDWVEVDEDLYYEYSEADFNMEIISKPYGFYEEEKVDDVTSPPGMAYVGDSHYGEWQTDNSGNEFWHFYMQWHMFNMFFGPGHYYYRSDWNHWNSNYRGRSSYYGRDAANPRYGTAGKYTRTAGSKRHYVKSGGLKRQKASIRKAARSNRGRGAGGRGK